ncbi:MAG: S8 family serine peptidase [Bdellovibrionaceae bacterium]|nr:S8 family serine peptidase [Bdellovibrionales bacterium]MCB9085502.1 S8 family serine peptidase [Pseudobdellovibrionaceae bacterium]
MDVTRAYIFVAQLVVVAAFTGCDKPRSGETVFPKTANECQATAVPGQYLVRWRNGHVTTEAGSSRAQFIDDFVEPQLEKIDFVEADQVVRVDAELESSSLYDYPDNWGTQRIDASVAWQKNVRGDNILVAVIDSGVDITHPNLAGRVYKNPGESGLDPSGKDKSSNGVDDDGNGFIDDVSGYDFVANSPHVYDNSFHGTHVSGIIAAEHSDIVHQTGHVQGVAPGATILPLTFIDATGGGTLGDAVRAIDYAVKMGAKIINASWGGAPCSQILGEKIASLANHNILFVAAAGNRSTNIDVDKEYPASYNYPAQITVGSTGNLDLMADHSNYGDSRVHLFAPGSRIVSTVPGGGYRSSTGTSMATPFVAGTAALIWSTRPQASASEIRQILLSTVKFDALYRNSSQGRLDIGHAIMSILP